MNDGPFYVVKQKRIEHLALTDIVRGRALDFSEWRCWGDLSPTARANRIEVVGLQLVDVQVLERVVVREHVDRPNPTRPETRSFP